MAPPYSSKEALIISGLEHFVPNGVLECSICREAISSELPQPGYSHAETQTLAPSSIATLGAVTTAEIHTTEHQTATSEQYQHPDSQQGMTTPCLPASQKGLEGRPEPETAVRIRFCSHIFGHNCLTTWFDTNPNHNRCPECNQILFPARQTHITLVEPTREMRRAFADVVEQVIGDEECAGMIRNSLMSEWTRTLMRHVILEAYRRSGYDVTFEYEGVADDDEEEDMEDQVEDDEETDDSYDEDDTDSEIDIENHGDGAA